MQGLQERSALTSVIRGGRFTGFREGYRPLMGKCGNMGLCPKTAWQVPQYLYRCDWAQSRKRSQVHLLLKSARVFSCGKQIPKAPVDAGLPGAFMGEPLLWEAFSVDELSHGTGLGKQ